MQFHKNSQSFLLIFIICCIQSALTSMQHHKGRSGETYRVFPLYRRKLNIHGRSATSGFDKIAPLEPAPVASETTTNGEGRDLFKKFLLFKSLFQQQKSAPSNNVIIITQPSLTTTTTTSPTLTFTSTTLTPTTTGNVTTTTTAREGTPTGTVTFARDTKNEGDAIEMATNLKPEELAQQLLKRNKIKKIRNNHTNRQRINKNAIRNINQQQQQIAKNRQHKQRLRKRKNVRKRLQQQKQQQHQQQQNQQPYNIENLISNLNSPNNNKRLTHNPSHSSNGIGSNNNAPGIVNLNTNMRLQNIMNAFRQQTPIVYNY